MARLVYVSDFVAFAKKTCRQCLGQGFLTRKEGSESKAIPCGCAARRFHKVHKDHIEVDGNDVRWKPTFTPPEIMV